MIILCTFSQKLTVLGSSTLTLGLNVEILKGLKVLKKCNSAAVFYLLLTEISFIIDEKIKVLLTFTAVREQLNDGRYACCTESSRIY